MSERMKKNERLQALTILLAVLQQKTPLSHRLQGDLTHTPFTKELCFGVCRHYYRLERLADCLVKKRPTDLTVWLCVLLGLYQLHYLRTPDYAVVKETVNLLDRLKKPWAKGLVNAVLRTYCRETDDLIHPLQQDMMFYYGHPDWFIKRVQQAWPNDWDAILQANDCHAPMSLRVNATKYSATDYLTRLEAAGIHGTRLLHSEQGIQLTHPCPVTDLPDFLDGAVSVQDEAAQFAVTLLDLKPGLRLLDACAAPGGKTCHSLEIEPDLGACVALDIEKKRLDRVRENLHRLQLRATLQEGDALNPASWWDGQLFDRILLDAPCSATGVIRRHPDIKLLRTEAEIRAVVEVQHAMLRALWPLLAPSGLLVYATCSIMPEENELQIKHLVEEKFDCECLPLEKPWGRWTGHGIQLLPGEQNRDGFFYSVLKKRHAV